MNQYFVFSDLCSPFMSSRIALTTLRLNQKYPASVRQVLVTARRTPIPGVGAKRASVNPHELTLARLAPAP